MLPQTDFMSMIEILETETIYRIEKTFFNLNFA